MSEGQKEITAPSTRGILPAKSVDRRLIKAASTFNKTPQELSDAVGGQLTPAQAVHRLNEILDSVTVLDEVKQRRIFLMILTEHLDWMKEKRDDPRAWSAINRTLKLVSDQIERTNINVDEVSAKLGQEHARFFVEGFMRGHEATLRAYAERHDIVIEEEEMLELAQVGVGASEEYLEKVTVQNAE